MASSGSAHDDSVVFVVRHGDRFDREVGGWDGKDRWWPDGDTEADEASHGANAHDPPLSSLGMRQAVEVGHWLATRENVPPISKLIVSPYIRTIQTAAPLAAQLNLKMLLEDGIAEGTPNRGGVHGIPMPAERFPYMPCVDTDYAPLVPMARDQEEGYPESYFTRVITAADRIDKTHCEPGSSVVLVSHAATVVAAVACFLGVSVSEVPPAGPASIYQLRRRGGIDGKWEVELSGGVDHLSEARCEARSLILLFCFEVDRA
jgi:broad specificity phosphatase PhoE